MKRINTFLKTLALTVCAAALLVSCEEEPGIGVARAVLGDVSVMNFTAKGPKAQTVKVVSDGEWHTTAPEWITVDPSTGSGTTMVTVTASENVDAQGMLEPRKDTLIISGNSLASRLMIFVNQEGDAYRNAQHLTLDKVAELADGKSFILDEATVVALSSTGFIVNAGTTNVYVKSDETVSVGDVVSVKGIKGKVNELPAITQADEVTVKSSGAATYPEPVNLNNVIATYTGAAMEYITVSGVVAGGNLKVVVDETEYSIKQIDATDDMKLSNLGGHKVTVKGYFGGILGAKLLGVIITELQDDGLDQLIYFEDDFEWLAPWTTEGVGDDVTDNTVNTDTAPNIFANAEKYATLIQEFQTRGYGYIWGWKGQDWSDGTPDNGNKSTLYIQKNYLKFGKTSYSSGIILPALKTIEGTADVTLTFDWCYCMTGGSKPDLTTITAVLTGGGTFASNGTEISDEIVSGQVVTDGGTTSLAWQTVELSIKGATSATRITIRPTNNDPDVTNSARHQNRWYLDNIKVVPANGSAGGDDPNAAVLPVEWSIQTDANNFGTTWPLANGSATEEGVSGYIASVTGTGTIWYNNAAGVAADVNKKTKLDVSGKDPRVTGAWIGDYCQFKVPGSVAKGKKVRITFETRTSATNPKYWELQYLDGTEFKPAAEIKKVTVEGEGEVSYTHAMAADGSTNIQVDATVTYAAKTENIVFRFVCKTAMQSSEAGLLTAPNGGTWRLAVTHVESTDWQPRIQWGE